MMKKWFWLLCLPLMMFSCDFFSDGEDDDDGLIIDPPETFSFFYDLQAIAGDTLTLTTYTRLVDPKVFLNDMPMEVTVLDRLTDGVAGDGNMPVSGSDAAYYVKVSLPASLQGEYELRVAASRADSPQMGELSLLLGYVYVYTMQADDLGEFHTGRPAWVDLSDALALLETVEATPEMVIHGGMKYTTRHTLDSLVCFDARQQPLPRARLYAFHKISDRYVFATLTYVSYIDTVYSEMGDYVASRQPLEETCPVVVLPENGLVLSLEDAAEAYPSAFNNRYGVQFRCESGDEFYFMPEYEWSPSVTDAPIYRLRVDRDLLAMISLPMEAEEFDWQSRRVVEIEQVYDGGLGAANTASFSWQVYDGKIVLNESTLIDGEAVCTIQPNSGTPSSGFFGTPSVFVSPQGALCTLRRTSKGYYQTEQLNSSSGSYRWYTHHQYFDFEPGSFIVVTRTTDNVYISASNRYYSWTADGNVVSTDCQAYDESFIVAKNHYPYADSYLYSTAEEGLFRARLDARNERSLVLPASKGEVYQVEMSGERALITTRDGAIFVVDGQDTHAVEPEGALRLSGYGALVR